MAELNELLAQWHEWRRQYSVERGYARLSYNDLPADDLDHLTVETIEREVAAMAPLLQLAVQHWARAQCMGVEVIHSTRLGPRPIREALVARALSELERRLAHAGVMQA